MPDVKPEDASDLVEEELAKEHTGGRACYFCGDWHTGKICPRVYSVSFDPATGKIIRYEFFPASEMK